MNKELSMAGLAPLKRTGTRPQGNFRTEGSDILLEQYYGVQGFGDGLEYPKRKAGILLAY